jgi:Spy/CpxP family protein refolding chaperone
MILERRSARGFDRGLTQLFTSLTNYCPAAEFNQSERSTEMNKTRTVAIATTLALGIACFAQTQQPSPSQGRGAGHQRAGSALKTYLSLTDAQVETLRSARQKDREQMRANAEEMRAKRKALQEQMNSASADPTALGNLMLEMRNARQKAREARKQTGQELLASLTPEQKTKLEELKTAAKRGPAAREAMMLGLIDPPTREDGSTVRPFGRGGAGRGPGMGFRPQRF